MFVVVLVVDGSVQTAHSNMASLDLLVGAFHSLGKLHQLPNCRLRPWFLADILACAMEERELLEEIYVRDCLPVDLGTRGIELCGSGIVNLYRVPNRLPTML